ncbi:MAG: hypothetical protein IJ270_02190 [Paludibacteraceae bacterium]|nr:hypothetical protein [Paludibacteraceae bacterium]
MKRLLTIFGIFLLSFFVNAQNQEKILSINNSLIDYNNQAIMFDAFAASAGKNANWSMQTRLGMTLQFHYDEGDAEGNAKAVVKNNPWTHIVLQEQSSRPRIEYEAFDKGVKAWVKYIRKETDNKKARIILAENWAYVDSENYEKDRRTLLENYAKVAKKYKVSLCPIGEAYALIYASEGEAAKNELYTDNRHPSVKATYLAVCCEYCIIYNESPIGVMWHPEGICDKEALHMQEIAWNTYQNLLKDKKIAKLLKK